MRCAVVTAAVALVLVGTAHDSGAQTRAGGNQQQPVATQAPRAPQNQPPAPGPRFTSTLKFVPPPPDIRPVPLSSAAFLAQGPSRLGPFSFWPWGAWLPVPLYTVPAPYEPPLEGAPVGGVQLDIDPRRAQVYVDGAYAGLVEEFSGYFQHLELPAGPHDIAVVAPGYEPISLHVIVSPGATLTQRATLSRAYGR
jgi:PEGA domain